MRYFLYFVFFASVTQSSLKEEFAIDDSLEEVIDSWREKDYRYEFIWKKVSAYRLTLKKEAKKLGVDPVEYLKTCEVPIQILKDIKITPGVFSQLISLGWNEAFYRAFSKEMRNISFNNSLALLFEVEQRAPETFEILHKHLQLFNTNTTAGIDDIARSYLRKTIYGPILEAAVMLAVQSTNEWLEIRHFPWEQKAVIEGIDQSIVEYKALPESAKNSLERVFCLNSTFHIIFGYGDFSNLLDHFKRWFEPDMKLAAKYREAAIFKEETDKLEERPNCYDPIIANILKLVSNESFNGWLEYADGEKAEVDIITAELKSFQNIQLKKRSEIIDTIKKYALKMVEILIKDHDRPLKKYIDKLDITAQVFIQSVGEELLEALAGVSPPIRYTKSERLEAAEELEKSIAEYKSLPQSSKDNLEKVFCVHTTFRIERDVKDADFSSLLVLLVDVLSDGDMIN